MNQFSFRSARPFCGTPKRLLSGLLMLVACLFPGTSRVHAGPDESALFIDDNGNVGIGTTQPDSTLDVRGKARVQALEIAGDKGSPDLGVRGSARFHKLEITDAQGTPYPDNWIGMADNVPDSKMKWLHIGGITDGVDNNKQRRIALYANTTYIDGNVGISTKEPKARLDVNGDIKATSINGEKPPMVFEVGTKGDLDNNKWNAVEKDIGALCGDADGCTMRFMLRDNANDNVKTISEMIYIEQPDKSNNKTPGLQGFTRQGSNEEVSFVLNTDKKNELVPHPWEWIWVLNYSSSHITGKDSNAYLGYKIQFLTRPNVAATVIIYDH